MIFDKGIHPLFLFSVAGSLVCSTISPVYGQTDNVNPATPQIHQGTYQCGSYGSLVTSHTDFLTPTNESIALQQQTSSTYKTIDQLGTEVCGYENNTSPGISALIVQRMKLYNACVIARDELVMRGDYTNAMEKVEQSLKAFLEAKSVEDYLKEREEAAQKAKEYAENASLNAAPAMIKYPAKLVKILGRFMTDIEISDFMKEVMTDVAKDKAQDAAVSKMDLFEPIAQNVRNKYDAANWNQLPKLLASYDCK